MKKKKNYARKFFWAGIKGIIFALFACYALLNVYGYRFDLSTQSLQETGIIEIRTHPRRVNIFLDGQLRADRSPYEINGVEIGTHALELQQNGFLPFIRAVTVAKQFVLRMGTIYLLPEKAETYLTQSPFVFDQHWETRSYLLLNSQKNQRLAVYAKDNGMWSYADTPVTGGFLKVIEQSPGRLLFLTEKGVFSLQPATASFKLLPFTLTPDDILAHGRDPDVLLYLKNRILFSYDLISQQHQVLKRDITALAATDTTLFLCDPEQQLQQFSWTDMEKPTTLPLSVLVNTVCPVKEAWEENGQKIIWTQAGDLFVDSVQISRQVSRVLAPESNILLYTTQRGVYMYDLQTERAGILTRFSGTITNLAFGPDSSHLFVTSGQELYFCHLQNNYCQPVVTLALVPDFLFFQAEKMELLIPQGTQLYQLGFPFWKI